MCIETSWMHVFSYCYELAEVVMRSIKNPIAVDSPHMCICTVSEYVFFLIGVAPEYKAVKNCRVLKTGE